MWELTCHYSTADGSIASFEDKTGRVNRAVVEAGLRGVVKADAPRGLPEKPLPKPQDATGAEADIYLCVAGAESLATTAKGCVFIPFTQPCEEGDRMISLLAVARDFGLTSEEANSGTYTPDLEGKPPRPDVCF